MSRDLLREIAGFTARLVLHIPEDEELTFLELRFPADTKIPALATRQLFSLLDAGAEELTWLERLAAKPKRYSLELVATRTEGIRYILAAPASEAQQLRYSLMSYLPGLRILEIPDYLQMPAGARIRVGSLRVTGDLAVPLKSQGLQVQHDPIAFIAGQMTNLKPDEIISYQIVVTPVSATTHPAIVSRIKSLEQRIMGGYPVSSALKRPTSVPGWMVVLLWILEHTLGLGIRAIAAILLGGPQDPSSEPKTNEAPPAMLPKHEQVLADSIQDKITGSLFGANIRVLTVSTHRRTATGRLKAILTSFRLFAYADQSLMPYRRIRRLAPEQFASSLFVRRKPASPATKPAILLGLTELADLFHFPDTAHSRTEGLSGSRSAELPLPVPVRNAAAVTDTLFGTSQYGGHAQDIRLPEGLRLRHNYVIGRTGTGKSTMLARAIYEDIRAGRGVAVLDPHADMLGDLLKVIPPEREKDVVIFDPSEREWPIGINILNPNIPFTDDIDRRRRITSGVLTVFAKMTDKKYWGHRMQHILRNATLTALSTPDPNLYTIQRLLTDKHYEREVAATLKDPILKQFWTKELARAGDYQITSFTTPLTHRLGDFITTGMSRYIMLQKHSTISVADIMNEGKILLVNLSKDELGEDQSSFFGTLITSLIWMAAVSRGRIPEPDRRNFYLYVDEFQNFSAGSYAEIASEGRKFHLGLTLAHQSTAQIEEPDKLDVIAANAGNIISFAVGPKDEHFILPYMAPVVEEGQVVNLAPFHFVAKTRDIPGADAFSGVTKPFSDILSTGSPGAARRLRRQSNHTYGVNVSLLDHYFDSLFLSQAPSEKPPAAPKTVVSSETKPKTVAPPASKPTNKQAAKGSPLSSRLQRHTLGLRRKLSQPVRTKKNPKPRLSGP